MCVTTGYDVFTSVSTRVHIVCTAYGWVSSCSAHTAHNTLTALTSAHLWCVSTVETYLVCMSCAGKVHTPRSVWSPHYTDVPSSQHTPMCPHCTFIHSMCRVHIGACVVDSYVQWDKDPNTMVSGSHSSEVPHCSVHATCFNHEDQVPMSHG